jgi:hypothetical protein
MTERFLIHPAFFSVATKTLSEYMKGEYAPKVLELVKKSLNSAQECCEMAAALGFHDVSIASADIVGARNRVCERILALKGNNCTLDVFVAALKPSMISDLDRIRDLRDRAELAPLKILYNDFAMLCCQIQDCASLEKDARITVAKAAKILDFDVAASGRRALLGALAQKGIFTSTMIREDVWDAVPECLDQIRSFARSRGLVPWQWASPSGPVLLPIARFFAPLDAVGPTPPPLPSLDLDVQTEQDAKERAVADVIAAVKNARANGVDAMALFAAFNEAMK